MIAVVYSSTVASALSAAVASSPSLSLLAVFGALAVISIVTAGMGTVRLIDGIRAADVSTLWEANKMYFVAAICGAAFAIMLRLSGLSLLDLLSGS